ncbi:hypothetical protein ALT717_60229 [Alteromonas macleodii]
MVRKIFSADFRKREIEKASKKEFVGFLRGGLHRVMSALIRR